MPRALAALLVLAAVGSASLSASADTPTPPHVVPVPVVERQPPAFAVPRAELVGDGASTLPTFFQNGRRFVLGAVGERYRIRIVNPTAVRVEAVVAVDGLDAIDGRPASTAKRGYVIPAFGDVIIDGWRTSMDTVAAFRFSSVRDSYAAKQERPANVGVVGIAFYRERPPVVWKRPPVAWRGAAPAPSGAGGASADAAAPPASRPGLGTQFGETHDSHVDETSFVRADATPLTVSELRYDDRQGLVARGIPVPPPWDERRAEIELRDGARAFPDTRFAPPPR
jgi:hypothetical protein